jgi:hypothetical protein
VSRANASSVVGVVESCISDEHDVRFHRSNWLLIHVDEEERFISLQEVLPRLDHYHLLMLGFELFPPTLPQGDA